MTSDDLCEYVKTISTRDYFIKFTNYLNDDYHENNNEWENKNLEEFLEGLASFTGSMAGYYKNKGEGVDIEKITWRMAAEILLTATVYS